MKDAPRLTIVSTIVPAAMVSNSFLCVSLFYFPFTPLFFLLVLLLLLHLDRKRTFQWRANTAEGGYNEGRAQAPHCLYCCPRRHGK